MAVMVKLVVPVFLSVTVFAALVAPIASVEKVRLVGDKAALGAEIVASPLKAVFCEVCRVPKRRLLPAPNKRNRVIISAGDSLANLEVGA